MHIVDSQVHLWAAESPDRPWPPGRAPEAQKPYPIVKETMLFQMDLAKVSRVVIVPGALDHLDRIAGKHPGLKLVIDHVGISVRGKAPKVFDDLPAVCALAKHPNIAVKASGMPSLSAEAYPFRDLHPHIRTLVDAFGPRRVFWGTDLTRMPCTYYECITLFTEHLPWLKGEDLEWVMGRGVCEWLGWPLPRA